MRIPGNAQQQQDQHHQSVDEWAQNVALQVEDVALFGEGKVQDGQRGDEVDGLVQTFPVFLEADLPDVEGGDRQRSQQEEGE